MSMVTGVCVYLHVCLVHIDVRASMINFLKKFGLILSEIKFLHHLHVAQTVSKYRNSKKQIFHSSPFNMALGSRHVSTIYALIPHVSYSTYPMHHAIHVDISARA